MQTNNQNDSSYINPQNNPGEVNNSVAGEEPYRSSLFTKDQISIIRSYIENLSLKPIENPQVVQNLAKKISQQASFESKSYKDILQVLSRLLYSQSIQESEAIQNNEKTPQANIKEQFQQGSVSPQFERPQIKIPNNSVIQPRLLFRSFGQKVEESQKRQVKTFTTQSMAQFINLDNSFLVLKSANSFVKSSDFIKKSSNGFLTFMENGLQKKQQMQPEENNQLQFPSFSKKPTKQFKQSSEIYASKSKRKIRPTSPLTFDPSFTAQQKIQWAQNNTNDCHFILQKKLLKKTSNNSKQPFYVNEKFTGIYNEYFYSNYDKIYFNQENNFSKLLYHLGFDSKRISFGDLKLVRQILPTSKLFNVQFIISQQNKLNEFRSQLRQLPKQARNQDIELVVGRQVIALHPICGHLHNGTILAIYKENQYMVKFTRPQLGTQKVLDINISTRSLSNTNKAAIENIDYESVVTVIKLLQFKGDLIERFKEYNNIFEEYKEQNKQPEPLLLQEYGWIGSTINILSMGLRHIMAKFRIRGLNTANQQLVGKNFSSLLVNPLSLMSKQLQNSSELSDVQTSNQIKKMISHRSINRIEEYVMKLSDKNIHYLESSEMNPEQKQGMSSLLKNFLAMLLNLRYDGRNFNMQSNKYLNNILAMIDGQYSQYFNQIYANIHSIIKKIIQND